MAFGEGFPVAPHDRKRNGPHGPLEVLNGF